MTDQKFRDWFRREFEAERDLLKITLMLAPFRAQLPHPESELWRLEPCDFEIYREIQAKTKINPAQSLGLVWLSYGTHQKTKRPQHELSNRSDCCGTTCRCRVT